MAADMQRFDVIVLGLGGIGSGAVYWGARRGARVLGLEQFELGHVHGGSQDHSRIIRLSYHREDYVHLAFGAYQAWEELERDAGERVVLVTGGLDLFPAGGSILPEDYTGSLDACGVAYERLDAGEIRRRWPQWRIADDTWGLYQEKSGLVDAARANAAHQRAARSRGAVLREGAPITAITETDGGVEVQAGGERYHAGSLVVAAGAWTNHALACFGAELPLTINQEQVTYFSSPRRELFRPERFPIWIWMDDPCFYGFPVYGEDAVKVAEDVGGFETTADTRTYDPDPVARQRVESFCRAHLPDALGPELYSKTCLYTLTPDRDFVIDAIPGTSRCFVAIGAGHAFKFASVIGRVLAELALDGGTGEDLSGFRIDRPILREKDPPKSFRV